MQPMLILKHNFRTNPPDRDETKTKISLKLSGRDGQGRPRFLSKAKEMGGRARTGDLSGGEISNKILDRD